MANRFLSSHTDRSLDELAELAAALCDAPLALVTQAGDGRQWLATRIGNWAGLPPRPDALDCKELLGGGDLVVVSDARADARMRELEAVAGPPHVRFYAGMLLRNPDGTPLATLCVVDQQPRELSAAQRLALRLLGGVVALEVEARTTQTGDTSSGHTGEARPITSVSPVAAGFEAFGIERLGGLLETISDGFVALDADWRYTYVNRPAGAMLGRAPADLLGKHIWSEFPEGRDQPFQRAYEKAVREQRPQRLVQHYEPWDRWFENRIYPQPGGGVAIFFTEFTEQKRDQRARELQTAQLRELSARLIQVREEEAARLAREIHDGLGQLLTALKLDVAWLRLHSTEEAKLAKLAAMNGLIDQLVVSIRRMATDLRPSALEDLGLVVAVEALAREFQARSGIGAEVHAEDQRIELDGATATALYRILQEGLTNVVRHAEAKHVRITLRRDGDRVSVELVDDGRGITEAKAKDPKAIGLLGMRERAAQLGGSVEIGPAPGGGTRLVATVPAARQGQR